VYAYISIPLDSRYVALEGLTQVYTEHTLLENANVGVNTGRENNREATVRLRKSDSATDWHCTRVMMKPLVIRAGLHSGARFDSINVHVVGALRVVGSRKGGGRDGRAATCRRGHEYVTTHEVEKGVANCLHTPLSHGANMKSTASPEQSMSVGYITMCSALAASHRSNRTEATLASPRERQEPKDTSFAVILKKLQLSPKRTDIVPGSLSPGVKGLGFAVLGVGVVGGILHSDPAYPLAHVHIPVPCVPWLQQPPLFWLLHE